MPGKRFRSEKRKIGRALSQPAHEIGIPGFAERHIEPQPVALGHQPPLQVAPDPVEHLELEGLAARFWRRRAIALCLVDHFLIVRGDGRIHASGRAGFSSAATKLRSTSRFGLESNARGLEIGALAQADADAPPA